MIAAYTIILCLSAWIFSYGMAMTGQRVGQLFQRPTMLPAALSMLLPAIAFLAVVGAKPAALMGALALLFYGFFTQSSARPHPVWHYGLPLTLALWVASSVTFAPSEHIPTLALYFVAWVGVAALTLGAPFLPKEAPVFTLASLAILVPLLIAPLMGMASFVALDVAILISCLMGSFMVTGAHRSYAVATRPFMLITAWLILAAFAHGAWIAGLISLLAYGAALAYGLSQKSTHLGWHVS